MKPKFLHESRVYEIENRMNGRRYIGSATRISIRYYDHFGDLDKGIHKNKNLRADWGSFGKDKFEFRVLVYCDKKMTLFYEQRFLDFYNKNRPGALYNINPVAKSRLGSPVSKETREKLRMRMLGNKHSLGQKISPEHRAKISASLIGNTHTKGYKPTQETIAKQQAARAGYRHSEETKRKISNSNKGKTMSDETRRKLRESHIGKKQSEDTISKRSMYLIGRPVSEATRRKISNSLSGHGVSDETKEKTRTTKRIRRCQKRLSLYLAETKYMR